MSTLQALFGNANSARGYATRYARGICEMTADPSGIIARDARGRTVPLGESAGIRSGINRAAERIDLQEALKESLDRAEERHGKAEPGKEPRKRDDEEEKRKRVRRRRTWT